MIKKILTIFALYFACQYLPAQNMTALTGTVFDLHGQQWSNATWSSTTMVAGAPGIVYFKDGTQVPSNTTGQLDINGKFSGSLPNSTNMYQTGVTQTISVCPNATAACVKISAINIHGASYDLGDFISNNGGGSGIPLQVIQVLSSSMSYAYDPSEIITPKMGDGYTNTLTGLVYYWNGTAWINSTVPINSTSVLLSQLPTSGLVALYTHIDCTQPYKDYSGHGYDGRAATGVNPPSCGPNGEYYDPNLAPMSWTIPPAATAQGSTYIFSLLPASKRVSGNEYPAIIASDTTGGLLSLTGDVTGDYLFQSWAMGMGYLPGQYKLTSSNANTPSASVFTYEIGSGAANLDQLFNNGVEQPYSTQGFTTVANFNVGNIDVGGFTTHPFSGYESVTLIYSRKLTAVENAQVAAVLNAFTQTRSNLVTPIPTASTTANNIVCNGDSITDGLGVPNSWCTSALFNVGVPITISHPAAAGNKLISGMASNMAQDIIPYFSVTAPTNTSYVMGGINEFHYNTLTAAEVWGQATRAAANMNYKHYPAIYIPMLSSTGLDTQKDAYNTLSIKNCFIYFAYCVAPDDPLLYADGASANTTYFQADGIHPTTAGQTLLALYASNAWKQVYGSTLQSPTIVSTATYTVLASDNYITATANSAITLYNCLGYSKFVHIKVMPGLTVTVANATAAQTIDGVDHSTTPLSLTAGNNYQFQVVPGNPATGGCTWIIN